MAAIKRVVARSIETPDGVRCVDVFREPDGQWGYEEFRRDPEDGHGWRPVSIPFGPFDTEGAALTAARARIAWLAEQD
jgi:hypothetical protein